MGTTHVIVKSLGNKKSMIQFAPPSNWKPDYGRFFRGRFVDTLQLGNALYARSDSLASQGDFLRVQTKKGDMGGYSGDVTPEFIQYCWNDGARTFECYLKLVEQWEKFGCVKTDASKIFSGASVAKAILREARISPLWETMNTFFHEHPEIIGQIMQGFYGGRVEPKIRCTKSQIIYADMTSMYPTVSTLMGLDHFLIAQDMSWRDATEDMQQFLNQIAREGVDALAHKPNWRRLIGIAKIRPNGDRLPARIRVTTAKRSRC